MHKREVALSGLESNSGMCTDYSITALMPRSEDAGHVQSVHWFSRMARTTLRSSVSCKAIKLCVRGTSCGTNTSLKEINEAFRFVTSSNVIGWSISFHVQTLRENTVA